LINDIRKLPTLSSFGDILISMLAENPYERPTFSQLVTRLETMKKEKGME
jgi:hypothetical protein